jgi:hypothetical protein
MSTFESVAANLAWKYSRNLSRSSGIISEVYHYTGIENLTKILKKKELENNNEEKIEKVVVCLRLTDIRCLNDYTESQDALKVFKTVCETMKDDGSICLEFYNCIKDLVAADTSCIYTIPNQVGLPPEEKITLIKPAPCFRYVCCFSKQRDWLPLWNYYVHNTHYEGYSIGLRKINLQERTFRYFDTQYQPYIVDMIYEESIKQGIIRDAISKLNTLWNDKSFDLAQYYFGAFLWSWSLVFKNEAFKHEEEVRLVFDIPVDEFSWAAKPLDKLDEIEIMYRSYHGLLSSYFDMYFTDDVLDSVTIGPATNNKHDQIIQEDNVFSYLKSVGFSSINRAKIKYSNIPVRF